MPSPLPFFPSPHILLLVSFPRVGVGGGGRKLQPSSSLPLSPPPSTKLSALAGEGERKEGRTHSFQKKKSCFLPPRDPFPPLTRVMSSSQRQRSRTNHRRSCYFIPPCDVLDLHHRTQVHAMIFRVLDLPADRSFNPRSPHLKLNILVAICRTDLL